MYNFKELSDWLPIETIASREDENHHSEPTFGFYFNQMPFYIDDFVRIHDSPWIDDTDYPEYIHGMEMGLIDNPLFIEIDHSGEEVKVYELKEGI